MVSSRDIICVCGRIYILEREKRRERERENEREREERETRENAQNSHLVAPDLDGDDKPSARCTSALLLLDDEKDDEDEDEEEEEDEDEDEEDEEKKEHENHSHPHHDRTAARRSALCFLRRARRDLAEPRRRFLLILALQ